MQPADGLGNKREPRASNDNSQIAGWAATKNGQKHAVLWTLRSG